MSFKIMTNLTFSLNHLEDLFLLIHSRFLYVINNSSQETDPPTIWFDLSGIYPTMP